MASDTETRSINEHIAFFTEDKETPFEIVKITTNRVVTPFTVYVKNISEYLLNNFKLFLPTGFKQLSGKIPKELKPNEGFFLELEVDSSKSVERFIQIEGKPHSVVFE